MPGEQTGGYGSGSTEAFWRKHSIKTTRDQPGNPHADGERRSGKGLPSKTASVSHEKAKEILKHGKVRGKNLTPAQKGFFGAVAGKGKK